MARVPAPPPPAPVPGTPRLTWLALFAGLVVTTLLVYQPAWHGAPLWDDDGHLTRAELRSVEGLGRIWTDVTATQQYYPLVHSAFWLMHRLWGDHTTGYHIVNIALHACSAFLFAVLLRRLSVPGAWFAAFVFALHPVHVESVAWMTELKNTLSTPIYLLAALAYLRFEDSRRGRDWALALALFAMALLAKTVTATLPISLLILAWWRRGALSWARDVRPALPFVLIGIAAGALTAWVEHAVIGAKGSDFGLTLVERFLVAGRAVWFYLLSLVWPANLVFIYPRWTVSQAVWWQYLFPAALAGALIVLWRLRGKTRAPLTALLLYGAALAPALGFVDVYPFRYSFVADHFQYAASLAPIAFLSAAGALYASAAVRSIGLRFALAAAVLAPLAVLSWHHSHQYRDNETLYRTTIARNPGAWMAHHNLGLLELHEKGDLQAALGHVEESLRLNPENAEALNSRGFIRQRLGDKAAARRDYEASIRMNPTFSSPYNNLGVLTYSDGRLEEAAALYREASRLNPKDPEPPRNLGIVLLDLGRTAEAAPFIRRAYELNPEGPDLVSNLASLLLREGRADEAVHYFKRALELRPDFPAARNNFGLALEKLGRLAEAEEQYREVIRLDAGSATAHDNLGYVLMRQRKPAEALPHLLEAIRIRPGTAETHASLAATYHALGRLDESIAAYRRALEVPPNETSADLRNSYGVALAERGRMAEAAGQFREALRLDPNHPDARANLARALRR